MNTFCNVWVQPLRKMIKVYHTKHWPPLCLLPALPLASQARRHFDIRPSRPEDVLVRLPTLGLAQQLGRALAATVHAFVLT